MYPKIRALSALVLLLVIQVSDAFCNPPVVINEKPSMTFNFETCFALSGPASHDYSEMQPLVVQNDECSGITMLSQSLYRVQPIQNGHSCAPGFNGGTAMCISSSESCTYNENDLKSLRLNVMVTPGPNGLGALEHIAFQSKAPQYFEYVDGTTGLNNYPTKLRLRIKTETDEVYLSDEIATTLDWSYKSFDLDQIPGLLVSEPTMFQIEILPYCLVGNGAASTAWDIDDLVVTAGCTSYNGGVIASNSIREFCSADGGPYLVEGQVTGNRGAGSEWVILDPNNNIARVSSGSTIDFAGLNGTQYFIYHLGHEGDLTGLVAGAHLSSLQGCYDLSNSLSVIMNQVTAGNFLTNSGMNSYDYCYNLGNNLLVTDLNGHQGSAVHYVLVDAGGVIRNVYGSGNVDLATVASGDYQLYAISSIGPLGGAVVGANLSGLNGCFEISNSISVKVNAEGVRAGNITANGLTTYDFCGDAGSLPLVLTGSQGGNQAYIISDFNGDILDIQTQSPIDLSGITLEQCFVRSVTYVDGLTGLEVGGLTANLDGCYELSNSVVVNKNNSLEGLGGVFETANETTSYNVCANLDNYFLDVSLTGNGGSNLLYVLVQGDVIQFVSDSPSFNFSSTGSGEYELYALSYEGVLTGLTVGQSLSGLDGCFVFSNPIAISVNAEGVSGGNLLAEGDIVFDFCGPAGSLTLDLLDNVGDNSAYVITDFNGEILAVQTQNTIDLSTISLEQCFVRNVTYEDGLTGLEVGELSANLDGCYDFSNSVTINKNNGLIGQGGTLTTIGGDDTYTVCPNQNSSTFTTTITGNGGNNIFYLLTQGDDIVFVYDNPEIDLSLVDSGEYELIAVSYDGVLGGLSAISSLDGCFVLSNAISISTFAADLSGGSLSADGGQTSLEFCGDISDLQVDLVDAMGTNSAFLVTDVSGSIISISDDALIDLQNSQVGECNIWHLSYELGISGLVLGGSATDLAGCFDLSNPVNVLKGDVAGGAISSDGQISITLCAAMGEMITVPVSIAGQQGANSIWIIADANGEILQLTMPDANGTIDIDGSLPADVQIFHLSYDDNIINLQAGVNIADVTADCFEFSNAITISREEVTSGVIIGPDSYDICLNDIDVVTTGLDLTLDGNVGTYNTWLVTDANGNVIQSTTNSSTPFFQYFPGSTPGTCLIYHLSHPDSLVTYNGDPAIDNLSLGCFDLSAPVTVNKKQIEAGTIELTNGGTEVTVIVGQGNSPILTVSATQGTGDDELFVVTDASGTILEIQVSNEFSFESAGVGICLIQQITFCGSVPELSVGTNLSILTGCFDFSNQIQVTREEMMVTDTLSAGTIMTSDNLTAVEICLGQVSIPQTVEVIFDSPAIGGDESTYVVTDDMGNILELSDTASIPFDNAVIGICNIYHVVYDGMTPAGLVVGGNISNLTGATIDVSNAIVVNREMIEGGNFLTTDGLSTVDVVVGDGLIDVVDFISTGGIGDSSVVVITSPDGLILDFPTLPLMFDSEPPGICVVWNLTYNTGLEGLAIGQLVADLDGCFALSNPVTINKTVFNPQDSLVGGVLSIDDLEICLGQDTVATATLLMAEGTDSQYAITDTSGIILEIITNTNFTGQTIAFAAGTPPGLCEIVHISSQDALIGLTVGQDIDTLSGDFALSNVVIVDRRNVDGGVISTFPVSMDTVTITVGDGVIDSIFAGVTAQVGDDMQWVITDENGIVLELPTNPPFTFENSGAGNCLIWNLSSSFDLNLAVGDNATSLDGCYDLSNPILVVKETVMTSVDGGVLTTLDGEEEITLCLNSGDTTVDDVLLSGAVGDSSVYILTDLTGFILAQFPTPPFNFDGTQVGTCQIWHLSYNDSINNLVTGGFVSDITGDFDFSNPITVFRNDPIGGTIMTTDSLTSVTIVVGDNITDTISVILEGADSDVMSWVVTDSLGNILELPTAQPFDFTNVDPGVCFIWNLGHLQDLTGLEVGNNVSMLVGCRDFSNSIEVIREPAQVAIVGGSLMTLDSMTSAEICLSGLSQDLDLVLTGNQGPNSDYAITTTAGDIIGIFNSAAFNFNGSAPGACNIVHVSSDNTLTGLTLGESIDSLGGNFELSNFVNVTKVDNDAGILLFNGTTFSDTIFVGDGIVDSLILTNTGVSADSVLYVISTELDTILEVQGSLPIVIDDNSAPGVCRIRAVAFSNEPTGLVPGNNFNFDVMGCFDPSNVVELTKLAFVDPDSLIAGTVSTLSGDTTVDLCIGANGGVIDLQVVGANGPNAAWILADTTGGIFAAPANMPITLNTLVADVCELHHIVYDSITGLNFGGHIDSLTGSFLLSTNFVTVNKSEVIGNSIELDSSVTSIDIIVGDGIIDTLFVTSSTITTDTSSYILVNSNGIIQSIQASNMFTFGPQISGVCTIYEVSYNMGYNGLILGDPLASLAGCFALSNAITINKNSALVVDGGVVTSPMGIDISICKTDTNIDTILANVTGAIGSNNAWVITDMNSNIISLPVGPPFVLDTSSLDQCQIWHMSYEDPLVGLQVGANINTGLTGLFDFNDMPITVDKNSAAGGTLTLPSGLAFDTIVLGSLPVDSLDVSLSGASGDTISWLVTDTLGNIILQPTGPPPFSFESLNPGTCTLWSVSYAFGTTGIVNGNSPADFDGCFDLSNPITVVKVQGQPPVGLGGVISLEDGSTEYVRCTGNNSLDSVNVIASGQAGSDFTYFITNTSGTILNIQDTIQFAQDTSLVNVEFAGDTLLLYHMGFIGNVDMFGIGSNIVNLDGSFGLSNPITLSMELVGAGIINTTSNTTIISGDGLADDVIVNQIGNVVGDTTFYVVYDDQGVILELTDQSTLSFDSYGSGTYFISFIAANMGYSGIEVNGNLSMIDGCFDLAAPIQIEISQATVSGGNLTSSDGNVVEDLCFTSLVTQESIDVILTDTLGDNFAWVVTNTDGLILDLPSGPPFIFDDQDSVACEIYNLSYDSTLVGLVIGQDIDTLMSTGLFALSNSLTVNKSIVSGGTLTTPGGQVTEEFCIGEGGVPDQLFLSLTGAVGTELTYVITDNSGVIQDLINGGTTAITVEGFLGDTCQVYSLSANEEVLGLAVNNSLSQLTGCFELSNSIELIKKRVNGGVLSTTPAAVDNIIDFCVSDGSPDSLVVTNNSTDGNYLYVLTDDNDLILEILTSDSLDFENSAFGVNKIYGVSYTGNFTGAVGDDITQDALSDDCYVASNTPITVNLNDCSQPIINEVYSDEKVELKNTGTAPIDISGYFLCANMQYEQLSNLNVVCGDLMLDPGELVVVDVSTATGGLVIDNVEGEMALYVDSGFGQSTSMRSYVEWGSTGHVRSGIAVLAGLWTTGEFAPSFGFAMSLAYDGDGILGADWSEQAPSECTESLSPGEPSSNHISYRLYPNPANEIMTLDVENLPEEEGRVVIYDSFGKQIMSKTIQRGMSYELDLTGFGPGIYHAKVISERSDKVQRLVLLK